MKRTQPVLKSDVKKGELFDYVIFLLSRQDYTEKKLRTKLSERYPHQSEWHDEIIARLLDMGYVNDEKFAGNYARSLLNQSVGKQKIREKMYHKGFSSDVIELTLESDAIANNNFQQSADYWREKWIGNRPVDGPKEYRRLMGRLVRKGFSYGEASNALKTSEQ